MRRRAVAVALIVFLVTVGVVAAGLNDVPTQGTIYITAEQAPAVGIAGGKTINMSSLGTSGTTQANLTNAGSIDVDGSSDSSVVVPSSESLDDNQVRVEQITATGPIGLETPGTQRVIVAGNIDNVTWRSASATALGDGVVDFAYGGPSGTSIVEVGGVPANTAIRAVDAQTGKVLDAAKSDGSGRVNFTDLPNSEHDVLLQSASAPDATNPQPQGDLSTKPTQLAVNISDADFPSDTVSVEFILDGSTVGTNSTSTDDTLTLPMPQRGQDGGIHELNISATDDFGNTVWANTTYTVPNNLTIRPETRPTALIDTTVNITAYYESGGTQQSITRTTSDGTINLTGFPANKPLVINADASGWRNRRIFVPNLYQQQTIFLLNESKQFTKTTFEIRDFVGDYPQESSVLEVRRVLNGTEQVVVGDYFGATGKFAAKLQYDQRYYLTVKNVETGASRDLGSYTPLSSTSETVAIDTRGNITRVNIAASLQVEPAVRTLPGRNTTINYDLQNESALSNVSVRGYYDNGSTNVTLFNLNTTTGSPTLNLTNRTDGDVIVRASWQSDSGTTRSDSATYRVVADNSGGGIALIPQLGELSNLLPQGDRKGFQVSFAYIITILGTAAVATRFRLPSEVSGLAAILMLTAFAVLGWVGYNVIFVAIVAWVSLAFIRRSF